jgi:hypothetical protein
LIIEFHSAVVMKVEFTMSARCWAAVRKSLSCTTPLVGIPKPSQRGPHRRGPLTYAQSVALLLRQSGRGKLGHRAERISQALCVPSLDSVQEILGGRLERVNLIGLGLSLPRMPIAIFFGSGSIRGSSC